MRFSHSIGMATSTSIALMLVATGFIWNSDRKLPGSMKNQNASVSVKDLSEIGVSIVSPDDPAFSSLLTSYFQGENKEAAQTLSDVSCFIKNDTDKFIIGYVVKWDMLTTDGKVRTRNWHYLASDVLLGRPLEGLRGVIHPHSLGFVSAAPLGEINTSQGVQTPQSNLKEHAQKIREGIAPFTNITISLDNILLDDGTFAGPDTSNSYLKIKARVEGRRDLLAEFENNTHKSSGLAFDRLKQIANGPKVKRNPEDAPIDSYNFQQQRSATELLRMRDALGDIETANRAIALLHRQWIDLRKH